MIAKGNLHGDGGGLARYLMTGKGDEVAELVETRGLDLLGSDPAEAFELLQKVAEANTRSTLPFFHVQTRLPHGEHERLTDAQLLQIADREEKRLGFDGQPRIVSFHIFPNGDKHLHVGWFRIDLETMRAIDPGLFKNNLKNLCRTLEKEYGLTEVSNVRKPEDIARIADRKEVEEARRLGMDDRAIRNTIVDCLQRTDGGKAFNAALDERGLMLANGDKRDCFVVIDPAGGQHALNKKLTGLTLAAMRDRLSDLDRSQLPSVDQAKAMQQEKYPTSEQAREAWNNRAGVEQAPRPEPAAAATATPEKEPQKEPPRSKAGADIHATWGQSPTPEAFVSAMHDQGYRMARVSPEEARESDRVAAFASSLGNRAPRYREGEIVAVNERGWTYRLNENSTGDERTDILKFTAELKDKALPGMDEARALQLAEANKHRQTEPWHQRDASKIEMKISGIQEAADRGGISVAAGLQAEGLTLVRVDMAGRSNVERENLRRYENDRLQGKTDARRRQAPNEGELVAVNRHGDVFRLNPRFVETDRLERDATGGKTPTLSQAQQHFATAREERRDERGRAWETKQEFRAEEAAGNRIDNGIKRAVPETVSKFGKAAFKVMDAGRVFGSIASFFESAFGMDGNAKPDHQQQQQAPQSRGGGGSVEEIWEEIYEAVQKGQSIPADTLRHMPAAELENLRSHGDAGIEAKIMDMQREKAERAAQEWYEYDHDRMGRER